MCAPLFPNALYFTTILTYYYCYIVGMWDTKSIGVIACSTSYSTTVLYVGNYLMRKQVEFIVRLVSLNRKESLE